MCHACGYSGCPHDLMHADLNFRKNHERPYGDMSPTNSDILGNTYGLDNGWKLGERLDFSGHAGAEPHLNLDLISPSGKISQKSKNLLGDNHFIKLWDK